MGMIRDALGFSNIHAAKWQLVLADTNKDAKMPIIRQGLSICGNADHGGLLYFVENTHGKNWKT